jgi:hypothetical protein
VNAADYKEMLACTVARFQERCALLADQLAEPHERYRLVPADLARLQAVIRNAITDVDQAFAAALVEACRPRVCLVRRARLHLVINSSEEMQS